MNNYYAQDLNFSSGRVTVYASSDTTVVWEETLSNWSGEESVTWQAVLNRSSLAQGWPREKSRGQVMQVRVGGKEERGSAVVRKSENPGLARIFRPQN